MLRGIRKASSNWVGKAIMFAVVGFLVISFAIWGIGDIFRGFGLSTVAKIGGTEITLEQFRQIYNEKLQQFSQQLGRPITPDQAVALGLDRQILGQLVAETALDERVRQLKLGISDEEVARTIRSDPNFFGINGQFDRSRFEALIRQAGFTETRFVTEQRRGQLRRQLVSTIAGGMSTPKAQLEAFHRFQNEQRSIEYVKLAVEEAGEIPQPTPEQVAAYFEERKTSFRAPEYRKITVVSVIPAEQTRWIDIPDAEARQVYEQRKARYTTAERRQILQIVFPNAEEAKAAADKIAAGATFTEIAAQRGLKESDIDLGSVTRASIIDRAIAEAAFGLKQGEISAPVVGRFGMALLRVDAIEPEHQQSYETVAADIKRDLAMERAKGTLTATYDKIEDGRAGGTPLAELADKLGVTARTIEAIDRTGRDASGQPVADLPESSRLLTLAFTTDVGVEVDPMQSEGGYVWFDVQSITPARDQTLDEVKDVVAERWREDEIANRLKEKATEIADKVKGGTPLAEAAGERKVETASELKRPQAGAGSAMPVRVVEAAFRAPKDGVGTSEGENPTEQFVFRVTDVTVPGFEAETEIAKRTEQSLRSAVGDAVLNEYIAQLEKDIGSSINRSALRQAVTGQTTPDSRLN